MDFSLNKKQKAVRKIVRQFCEKEVAPVADKIEEEEKIPGELIEKMAKFKLFGVPFDKAYGGTGGGFILGSIVLEELARVSGAISMFVGVNYLTCLPIELYGSEEQKKKFITPMAEGREIGSMAFTEAATGSDFSTITTRASLEGDTYIINGAKRFITAADCDGPIVFYARDGEEVSAFIGQKNTQGYTVPTLWKKHGMHGVSLTDIHMENYRVPTANLLGKKGQGPVILLDTIAIGKLDTCAIILGCAQGALDEAIKYAKERTARGKPIAKFPTIQSLISEMAASLVAARWMMYRLATMVDEKRDIRYESALAKMFVTEAASEIARKSLKVHGAYGYINEFKIERIIRDINLGEIVEGANEIQKMIIASHLLK